MKAYPSSSQLTLPQTFMETIKQLFRSLGNQQKIMTLELRRQLAYLTNQIPSQIHKELIFTTKKAFNHMLIQSSHQKMTMEQLQAM
jgi:hypothetical protein